MNHQILKLSTYCPVRTVAWKHEITSHDRNHEDKVSEYHYSLLVSDWWERNINLPHSQLNNYGHVCGNTTVTNTQLWQQNTRYSGTVKTRHTVTDAHGLQRHMHMCWKITIILHEIKKSFIRYYVTCGGFVRNLDNLSLQLN